MRLPMFGTSLEGGGSPVLAQAPGTGRQIQVTGLSAGVNFREGQFFSIETHGRHYVYMCNTDHETSAGPSGVSTLLVSPLLRVPHLANNAVHIETPMIEGLIEGDPDEWEVGLERNVELVFTIKETR